jgi:predicted HTH domain antitoxin
MDKIDSAKKLSKILNDRDRAVSAVLLLAYDGVISQSRAAELLGMSIRDIRDEFKRIMEEED